MSVVDDVDDGLKWDRDGLVAAVAQDALGGQVRMVGWMNREALRETLRTRRATFWSRSRGRLWVKGEESGHHLEVASAHVDCDLDTVLLLVHPRGPTCHTGQASCFFRSLEAAPDGEPTLRPSAPAAPLLDELEAEILARRAHGSAQKSYTRSLLEGGAALLGAKLREEAAELAAAVASESDARVAAEAADVVYHLLVGLASRDVPLSAVLCELERRRGTSGLDEKRSRPRKEPL